VARLASSRADTFFIATTPRFAIQAIAAAHKLGWKPKLVVNSVAASPTVMQVATHSSSPELTNGALSFSFLKDPADPRWRDDRGIRDYLRIMRTYASDRETEDVYHVYGMAAAYNMVEALRGAGKELTRKGLLASALRLNVTDNPFLLPGVVVRTSPTDHFPIEQGALQRWQNGRWIRISGLVSAPSK
jgi:branched-chain amino acid transport system substrate-binding protein